MAFTGSSQVLPISVVIVTGLISGWSAKKISLFVIFCMPCWMTILDRSRTDGYYMRYVRDLTRGSNLVTWKRINKFCDI